MCLYWGELETAQTDIILDSWIQSGFQFPSDPIHMYFLSTHSHLFSVLYTKASVFHKCKQMGEGKQREFKSCISNCMSFRNPQETPHLGHIWTLTLLHFRIWFKIFKWDWINNSGWVTYFIFFKVKFRCSFVFSEFWLHTSSNTCFYIIISVLALSLQNNSSGYSTWPWTTRERYFMIGDIPV